VIGTWSGHRPAGVPWRNLGLDLTAAIGLGTTTALIGAILPTLSRREGLTPLGLAALSAAPFLANLLSAFAGTVGPRSPRQLAVLRASGAALLSVLLLAPGPTVMVFVAIGYWLSFSFGTPYVIRMWGTIYPGPLRGRLVGAVGTGKAAVAAIAGLAGGVLADRYGGIQIVAIGGLVGAFCSLAHAGIATTTTGPIPRYSARDTFRAVRSHPVIRRVVLAQGFYGGGLIAAAPLYALVYVDRLGLSLADVGVIAILTASATTISFVAWGGIADRRGALPVLGGGSALGLTALVCFAFAPAEQVLWVAAVLGGAASAAIEVGIAAVVSETLPLEVRPAAMAGWNAVTGARGLCVPFVTTLLVELRVVDLTVALLLCAAATAVGCGLYLRTRSAVAAMAAGDPVTDIGSSFGLRRSLAGRARAAGLLRAQP
jgi:MFS family permease